MQMDVVSGESDRWKGVCENLGKPFDVYCRCLSALCYVDVKTGSVCVDVLLFTISHQEPIIMEMSLIFLDKGILHCFSASSETV